MLFSKYSTRLSYINVSPFHLGPATTLASLLLARAILQIFEATLYEFLDPWILLFLFKMAEPRRPIARMEVKNSEQFIIKVTLNGFKVRVKALLHDGIDKPSLLFVLIVNTVCKRFWD